MATDSRLARVGEIESTVHRTSQYLCGNRKKILLPIKCLETPNTATKGAKDGGANRAASVAVAVASSKPDSLLKATNSGSSTTRESHSTSTSVTV
ncbi:MAG: hypothetical protein CM15mP74_27820 [Halieaceae bacterium]|nr:MAG: hypothetical protein CM15mP74_27820 [Halieaceae bacterium]